MKKISLLGYLVALMTFGACSTELSEPESDEPVFVAEGDELDSQMQKMAGGWLKSPLLSTGRDFNRIALRFDASKKVDIEARTLDENNEILEDWKSMEYFFSEEIAHSVILDFEKDYKFAEIRYKSIDNVKVEFLVADLMERGESAESQQEDLDPESNLDLSDSNTVEEELSSSIVVSRSRWRARRSRCSMSRHKPKRITIHHTVSPVNDRMSVPARIRQIQRYHQRTRGYCELGYHFLIGRDGKAYQGRYETRLGAHTKGANTGNIGIAFVGNFVKKRPPNKMLDIAGKLMRQLSKKYGIKLNTSVVKGHRNRGVTKTVCPGWSFHKIFKKWVRKVAKGQNYSGSTSSNNSSSNSNLVPGDGSCYSATVGARVEEKSYVQVSRADCGQSSCAWFTCGGGSFKCSSRGPWVGEKYYAHAACD